MVKINQRPIKKYSKVSIIIPHLKGFEILDECVGSIYEGINDNHEVIIVDNNSIDGSIDRIKEKFSDIKIIKSDINLGYAGGCNLGAQNASNELLLFLNNDTTQKLGWIDYLVEAINKDDKIGIVQPKILNFYKKNQFDYAGASGGFIDIFCFPFTRGRIFDNIEEDVTQYDESIDIFWASGCSFIIRKDLFFNLNMFDKKLFAHMEEIDLCWKSKITGYKNVVEPKSIVYHKGSITLEQGSYKKVYLNHRNSLILFLTNHNLIITLMLLIPRVLLDILSMIRYLLIGKIKNVFAQIHAILWLIVHPIYLILRIVNINKIKILPLYSIMKSMLIGSIALDYFIKQKKIFSDF